MVLLRYGNPATITLRAEASLKQQAERIATLRDETLSQVVRQALREYVRPHTQLELSTAIRPKPRAVR
jgi:predicted transcriptional regulator